MQPISKTEQKYAEEVVFLRNTLAREVKERDAALRVFEKATDRWWAAASKGGFDKPESKKEAVLREDRDRLMNAWTRHENLVTHATEKLAAFDNEAAKERYIADREAKALQLARLRSSTNEREGRPPTRPKNELGDELAQRVVDMVVKQGMGITTVAKTLNAEKVPPPGRAKSWYAVTVHGIVKKATGKAVSELRK